MSWFGVSLPSGSRIRKLEPAFRHTKLSPFTPAAAVGQLQTPSNASKKLAGYAGNGGGGAAKCRAALRWRLTATAMRYEFLGAGGGLSMSARLAHEPRA